MEFHLPYLILRATSSATEASASNTFAKNQEPWQDVTFLNIKSNEEGDSHYSIQKAHISLVVTGTDHFRWTGYAFANTGVGDSVFDEDDEYDVTEEEYEVPEVDYFPSDGQGEVLLTDTTIQDPRRYWLRVVGLRLSIILKEWDYIVHKTEDSVRDWVSIMSTPNHPSLH